MNLEWKWQQENAKLQLEIQELQKALEFYADKNNYKLGEFRGVRRIVKIEMDSGEMARRTLEGLRSGSGNDNYEKSELGRAN